MTQGFPASLNIVTSVEAEAPSIDFAGAGRRCRGWRGTSRTGTSRGKKQIFASRFSATANVWLPSGQDRASPSQVPSLNINTNRDAENPAVVGGAAVAGADPVPWVAWQELDGRGCRDEPDLRLARRQAGGQRDRVRRASPRTARLNVNGFCWLQVGLDRLEPDDRRILGDRRPDPEHRPDARRGRA